MTYQQKIAAEEREKQRVFRVGSEDEDPDALLEQALISFSVKTRRVDYGPGMFWIEVTADVLEGPEGLSPQVGRLAAYRIYDPEIDESFAERDLWDHFFTFDNISSDASLAMQDLIKVQDDLWDLTSDEADLCGISNLVYVDQIKVDKPFRGHGLARQMMAELHDFLAGTPSLVFFQALPFLSELQAKSDTDAWVAEREQATAALVRYWTTWDDLKFHQPMPQEVPCLVASVWLGDMLEVHEPRCAFLLLEEVVTSDAGAPT